MRSVGWVLISLPYAVSPSEVCYTWSVRRQTYGYLPNHSDRCSLVDTELYCLVTEARVCQQLAQGAWKRKGRESNLLSRKSNAQQATHTFTQFYKVR